MGASTQFSLIETMLLAKPFGYLLLQYHMRRLAASSACLGFPFNDGEITSALQDLAAKLSAKSFWRVRLLLAPDGAISTSAEPVEPAINREPPLRAAISTLRVSSTAPMLRHKTTMRAMYDTEFRAWSARIGCFDVIFTNEHGQVTEGTRTNVFVQRGAEILTPPLECGLLDGTLRRWMLDARPVSIRECVMTVDDLVSADRIFLGNSVRGLAEVRL
jgi:para-aminobenzoate synthetase / 4-amino-4-deoxychorismate lyase